MIKFVAELDVAIKQVQTFLSAGDVHCLIKWMWCDNHARLSRTAETWFHWQAGTGSIVTKHLN